MSTAFTPGPWAVEACQNSHIVFQKSSRRVVCDVNRCYATGNKAHQGRQEADAQLIAAAPDLLAACRLFLIYHDSVDEYDVAMMLAYAAAEQAIRAAVTKAAGGAA